MSSSAKRALRILEFVGHADHPLGVTEIARALSLSPGTVYRGIDALNRADLVSRYHASSRYVLGARADRLREEKRQLFALGEPAFGDGRMPVAFPMQARGVGVAAITIDGPALEPPPHAGTHVIWDWLQIVTHFEYIGHVQPQLSTAPSRIS